MLNHARTLLINVAATPGDWLSGRLGDEPVDPSYVPVSLSGGLQAIRAVLFGADPDREFLNYRARQIMTLLHSTPLDEHLQVLDPRVSYSVGSSSPYTSAALFTPRVTQTAGVPADLNIIGIAAAPDASGRMAMSYRVVAIDENRVSITKFDQFDEAVTHDLDDTWLSLPDSGFLCKPNNVLQGQTWMVDILLRPQKTLADLARDLTSIGEPVAISLFGTRHEEPYTTFFNLWTRHPDMHMQMAGFLTAYIYRIEERRVG